MNRKELCNAIAAHTRIESRNVETVLKGFSDVVIAAVSKGEAVLVNGFAKFDRVQTNPRNGRNPATGRAITIPATKKAQITPLKGFQDVVGGNAPAPKVKRGASSSNSSASSSSKTNRSSSSTSRTRSSTSSKSGTSKTSRRPTVKTMTMRKSVKAKTQGRSRSLAKR